MAIVYRHRRLDTNEIFYIGVGVRKSRAYDKKKRSQFWKNIVKKYGYKVEIIVELESYEDALKLEIAYIAKYGRLDLGTGTLCNMTDGGQGTLGIKNTPEQSLAKSLRQRGRKYSEETKLKMSLWQKGKKKSESHVKAMSEAMLKNPTNTSPIMQFDLEGNYLKTFKTIREASREIGKDLSGVSKVCKGGRKTAAGYIWKYANKEK